MAEKVTYEIEFDTKGAVKGIKQVDSALDGLDTQAKKTSKGLSSMLDFLKPSPMALAAAGVTAIGTAFTFATQKTMEFDKAMSAARSVLGDVSDKDFAKLREAALEAGSTTAFTAAQAAEGLQFLGMAGYNATQSIEALPGVLNLAAASGIELGRAADIASDIMSQFQKPAEDTAKVVDMLAKTVTSSNQNMDQLADAMNYLGPTAAALKIPISETAAVTGIMASNGLKGSLGTRALGTAMVRLSKPTKAMKEKMKELNLEFFDQNGQFVGLIGLTKELERATTGMTDKQKQNTLATLFGAEAIQEMNILVSKGSKEFAKYSNEIASATGDASKMAEIRLNNLAGDITKLTSATEGLAIEFGQDLTPGLRDTIQNLTSLVALMKENKEEILKFGEPIGDIAEKTDKLATSFFKLFGMFSEEGESSLEGFYNIWENVGESIEEVVDFLQWIVDAIPVLVKGGKDIGASFGSMWDGLSSLGGLIGEDAPVGPKEDPNRVLTDTELGFTQVEPEEVKQMTGPKEEPVVLTPKTIASPAAQAAIEQSKTTKTKGTNVEGVSGPKTTNVTLNINKLIENMNITSQNLPDATAQIRDEVVKVLLTAANDVNLIAD